MARLTSLHAFVTALLVLAIGSQVAAERRWLTGTWTQMGVKHTPFVGDARNEQFRPRTSSSRKVNIACSCSGTSESSYLQSPADTNGAQ